MIRWEREEREKRGVWAVIGGEMGGIIGVTGSRVTFRGYGGKRGVFGGRLKAASLSGKINKS